MLRSREFGTHGPPIVVLHGGPGAPGSAVGLARALGARFRVLEPMQRGSGAGSLTVSGHVQDLLRFLDARLPDSRPALVGSSWGAMLALAFAAAHPERVGALALVGCGTFDEPSRAEFRRRLASRIDTTACARQIAAEPDPDSRLALAAVLMFGAYVVEPIVTKPEFDRCDARAHEETWDDMLRRQSDGTYPAAFASITTPVAMFHGAEDPHPGPAIRGCLATHIARLEYHEWSRCGHFPWLERRVREEFVAGLGDWLAARAVRDGPSR